MNKATIAAIDVRGKTCFCRVDYNVPLEEGNISDDTRIKASLPTVNFLIANGAKVVLASHLGRPRGKIVDKLRLDPVANRLSQLLGRQVTKLDDCVGDQVEKAVASMKPGEVVLLENLRFHPGEEKNDPDFAKRLAALGDIFVNDAFGAAHRAHASTAGIADYIPGYAGFLLEKEITSLGRLLQDPEKPFVAVIGGAKVSDKLSVLNNLLDIVDILLVGGGMANTFLMAMGKQVGKSLSEPGKVEDAEKIIDKAARTGKTLILPRDAVCSDKLDGSGEVKIVSVEEIPAHMMILDIGPATRKLFAREIAAAKTVFWNGPMGF